jgi:hypothetical protein
MDAAARGETLRPSLSRWTDAPDAHRPAEYGVPIPPPRARQHAPDWRIDFHFAADDEQATPPGAGVPDRLDVRARFVDDFQAELTRLLDWATQQGWAPMAAPELQVWVSDRFVISKSLAPAWHGHAGHMEFPARRAVARNAAILHELVHVLFPGGNRLLAEGLAVYLQAEIGGNPAFPNFGRPLHAVARETLRRMIGGFAKGEAPSPAALRLAELDRVATPAPLTLHVGARLYGEDALGQGLIYPLVGSFVQALIEQHGLAAFEQLYRMTPLTPRVLDAGAPARWQQVYGCSFSTLEAEWKARIVRDEPSPNQGESHA